MVGLLYKVFSEQLNYIYVGGWKWCRNILGKRYDTSQKQILAILSSKSFSSGCTKRKNP